MTNFEFVATRSTYLKSDAKPSKELSPDQSMSVNKGDVLSCMRVASGRKHFVFKAAALNGAQLRPALRFGYRPHWSVLPPVTINLGKRRDASADVNVIQLDQNCIHLAEAQSPILVVTFDFLGSPDAGNKPWGGKFIQESGWSLMGVTSKKKNWFRSPDLHNFLHGFAARGGFKKYDKVVFAGPSMGGFGAGVFCSLAPGSTVLATSPQSTLDPQLVPFESRYDPQRRLKWNGDFSDVAVTSSSAAKIFIAYDPKLLPDRLHVDRFAQANLQRIELPYLGHTIVSSFLKMNLLKTFMKQGVEGSLGSEFVIDALRKRRLEPKYGQRIARDLDRRGRVRLATIPRELGKL